MREHIMGVRVRATKPDTSTAAAKVSANSMNNRPVRPVAKASGAYTATRVSVMAITAKAISRTPKKAACIAVLPSSIWRYTFSSTTIASSTTRPIASTMASKVSVLIEKPSMYMMAKAPIREIGIVTMGITLARKLRRKNTITSTTSKMASAMVVYTESMDF